ncbi:hypothetical protein B5M10_10130 [Pluralibacter gergoviae]|uniref:DUF6402 family protein n=1 Tax=Pluralibacter gergoviae TaxID=61647 RepID=UPI000908113E|nr:DUF6402 family protein [Pluralibacter gergoviae]OUR00952.1 hypothetical protein B5M10_10130 [Pluralibacter gergoviae]
MTVSTTITSKEQGQQEKKVSVDFFHIDMIPDAMDKMKWPVAAKLMRHWFNAKPALVFTEETKDQYQRGNALDIPDSIISCDIVKMSWAIQFEQVTNGIKHLSEAWDSPKGREQLKKRLSQRGDYKKSNLSIGYSNDIRELEDTAQVNMTLIGSKTDTVNEWYGAIGNANLKICVRGHVENRNKETFFNVESVGYYLKDTYDFIDDGYPEPLGIWSKDRVLSKAESSIYISSYLSGFWGSLARQFSGFVPVFNADFRKWQKKHNSGGDFIVFSDIYWTNPLPQKKIIKL